MRLIVVDSCSDKLCGDVSASIRMFQMLPRHVTSAEIEVLAKACARLVDETVGRRSRSYRFSCFAPSQKCIGYLLYMAPEDIELSFATTVGNDPVGASLTDILTKCFYFGFVSSVAKPRSHGLRIIRRLWITGARKARSAGERVERMGAVSGGDPDRSRQSSDRRHWSPRKNRSISREASGPR
jgi:hypothetical protein